MNKGHPSGGHYLRSEQEDPASSRFHIDSPRAREYSGDSPFSMPQTTRSTLLNSVLDHHDPTTDLAAAAAAAASIHQPAPVPPGVVLGATTPYYSPPYHSQAHGLIPNAASMLPSIAPSSLTISENTNTASMLNNSSSNVALPFLGLNGYDSILLAAGGGSASSSLASPNAATTGGSSAAAAAASVLGVLPSSTAIDTHQVHQDPLLEAGHMLLTRMKAALRNRQASSSSGASSIMMNNVPQQDEPGLLLPTASSTSAPHSPLLLSPPRTSGSAMGSLGSSGSPLVSAAEELVHRESSSSLLLLDDEYDGTSAKTPLDTMARDITNKNPPSSTTTALFSLLASQKQPPSSPSYSPTVTRTNTHSKMEQQRQQGERGGSFNTDFGSCSPPEGAGWSRQSAELYWKLEEEAAALAAATNKKKSKSKTIRKKKDKDKPKRPLSAYNIFFKEERARILNSLPPSKEPVFASKRKGKAPHRKISFETLAKQIAERWHDLDSTKAAYYNHKAATDMKRYKGEMEAYWKKQQGGKQPGAESPKKNPEIPEQEGSHDMLAVSSSPPLGDSGGGGGGGILGTKNEDSDSFESIMVALKGD